MFDHMSLQVSDDFIREMIDNNITVTQQEIFLQDPFTRVQNLKVYTTFYLLCVHNLKYMTCNDMTCYDML